MEAAEASSFESSEMLATFLASTPLLTESWKLCSHANATAPHGFVTAQIGEVTYVGFSAVQSVAENDQSFCRNLVPFDVRGLFSAAAEEAAAAAGGEGQDRAPAMVRGTFLRLFLSIFSYTNFQSQVFDIMKQRKSLVFTGHSIGGTIASLSALWLLSRLQTMSSPPHSGVLCITFGSPLLGNESLSRDILQERWGGNFCHVVAKHDVVPRLLLAPLPPITSQLCSLLQYWNFSLSSPQLRDLSAQLLPDEEKTKLFLFVLGRAEESAKGLGRSSDSFWPFGSYLFCGKEGAVCVDNAMAVVKLLHLMLATGCASSSIEDHLKYGDYVGNIVSLQFLKMTGPVLERDESSYEAGITLALQSSGLIATQELPVSEPAKECLKMARRMGRAPNLNSANLAVALSKITPLRAQIEWYKATCDESHDQMGYYDTFKQRTASKRDAKINMNRIKLGQFWNDLIRMLETNQLPHDFHKRAKWVNASQFYKLLVEPLDIAEYYREGMHRVKGHYLKHGRERRYEIFDKWWNMKKVGEEEEEDTNNSNTNNKRSKFASLTQDSCFWAKVEEAREWGENVRKEGDVRKLSALWVNIHGFEQYAMGIVDRKEVSKDVLAQNSSYSLWVKELRELKSQLYQFQHHQFPRLF